MAIARSDGTFVSAVMPPSSLWLAGAGSTVQGLPNGKLAEAVNSWMGEHPSATRNQHPNASQRQVNSDPGAASGHSSVFSRRRQYSFRTQEMGHPPPPVDES